MASRYVHVFSNDPLLAPYLASYLQGETCNIREEEGKFYLRSSYFEKLPLLSTSAKRKRCSLGLASVLDLMSPAFDTLSNLQKREACINALLRVFNGALKLKYKNCGGLMRHIIVPSVVERGNDYEEDGAGKRVQSAFRGTSVRMVLTAGNAFFRQADRKQPSIKKIWNIARKNASVARALHHYEKSEDLVELRKVIEEIMNDTFTGTRTKKSSVPFGEWMKQKWTEPEISAIRMGEAHALLHNTLLLGEQALHSLAFADRTQAQHFTASGPAMPLPEARDIVHTILMKWISSKQ